MFLADGTMQGHLDTTSNLDVLALCVCLSVCLANHVSVDSVHCMHQLPSYIYSPTPVSHPSCTASIPGYSFCLSLTTFLRQKLFSSL